MVQYRTNTIQVNTSTLKGFVSNNADVLVAQKTVLNIMRIRLVESRSILAATSAKIPKNPLTSKVSLYYRNFTISHRRMYLLLTIK